MKTLSPAAFLCACLLAPGAAIAQAPATARLGVIGLGNRSRSHFAAFRKAPEARITALCDLDSQQIDRVNQELPTRATGYTDYRELIADRNVDAVVIVAPNFLHREIALAALRAGKDVLVEKPLALTYAEAKEVAAEAKRGGEAPRSTRPGDTPKVRPTRQRKDGTPKRPAALRRFDGSGRRPSLPPRPHWCACRRSAPQC